MKLAFCSEDRSDDEILRVLAERILRESVEAVANNLVMRRSGGWQEALRIAPNIARAVFRTEAHGAVFVIDNDGAPPHDGAHAKARLAGCRLCALEVAAAVNEVAKWSRPALPPLQFVFAVPVQMLETWLLLADRRFPQNRQALAFGTTSDERRELKKELYGNARASREERMKVCLPIAQAFNVDALSKESASFSDFGQQLRAAQNAVRSVP